MTFSKSFEADFRWYLSVRHQFSFDGTAEYTNKKGQPIIVYDRKGVSGKQAFFIWDSTGKVAPTKHPNLLHALLKTKGSVNLHIKMYAEDRATGVLPKLIFESEICEALRVPAWFREAVEKQKEKLYASILL